MKFVRCNYAKPLGRGLTSRSVIGRASGVFIDTASAMTVPTLGAPKGSNVRYGLIREAAEAFDGKPRMFLYVHEETDKDESAVDVMVVIGNEKLTIEMQKMFTKNGVTVISAPKSGGVSTAVLRVRA